MGPIVLLDGTLSSVDTVRISGLVQGLLDLFQEGLMTRADPDVRLQDANLGHVDAHGGLSGGEAFPQFQRPALPDHRIVGKVGQQKDIEASDVPRQLVVRPGPSRCTLGNSENQPGQLATEPIITRLASG